MYALQSEDAFVGGEAYAAEESELRVGLRAGAGS